MAASVAPPPGSTLARRVGKKSDASWGTTARAPRRAGRGTRATSRPSRVMVPPLPASVASSTCRDRAARRVDLPAPDGPTSATCVPAATVRDTPSKAGGSSGRYRRVTFRNVTPPDAGHPGGGTTAGGRATATSTGGVVAMATSRSTLTRRFSASDACRTPHCRIPVSRRVCDSARPARPAGSVRAVASASSAVTPTTMATRPSRRRPSHRPLHTNAW